MDTFRLVPFVAENMTMIHWYYMSKNRYALSFLKVRTVADNPNKL